MSSLFRVAEDSASQATLRFFQDLLRGYHPRNFSIELWDGTRWPPEPGQFCRFVWKINNPEVFSKIAALPDELSLGEAYISGDWELDGDIEAVFPLVDFLSTRSFTIRQKLALANLVRKLNSPRPKMHAPQPIRLQGTLHSKERDREAVGLHYDLSNDFYRLWLDQEMVYSCGYFQNPASDLDTAQRHRLESICDKLQLRPGEQLLDIGCGWGGLLLHAVRQYHARGIGITLSPEQQRFVQKRIQEAGLSNQCEVKLLDYRDLNQAEKFDKLVSVGMIEHVGESKLPEYFQIAFRLLKPGGAFLLSGISKPSNRPTRGRPAFVDAYVFPDGELVPVSTTLYQAEKAGFEIQEVEDLREHYRLTLCHWVNRLEAHAAEARALVGELKYRIWRLYMAGAIYYFRTRRLGVYQTLFFKHDGR